MTGANDRTVLQLASHVLVPKAIFADLGVQRPDSV